jgi:hypothetical protein
MTHVERDVAREDSIESATVDSIECAAVEDSMECAAVDSEIWFWQALDEISQLCEIVPRQPSDKSAQTRMHVASETRVRMCTVLRGMPHQANGLNPPAVGVGGGGTGLPRKERFGFG